MDNREFENLIINDSDSAAKFINEKLALYGTKWTKEQVGFTLSPKIKTLFEQNGFLFCSKFNGNPARFQKINGDVKIEHNENSKTNGLTKDELNNIRVLLEEYKNNKEILKDPFYKVDYNDTKRQCLILSQNLEERLDKIAELNKPIPKYVIVNKIIELGLELVEKDL